MTREQLQQIQSALVLAFNTSYSEHNSEIFAQSIATLDAAISAPGQEPPPSAYNLKRIAWELERTAMNDGYYGNALRVAKDLPVVTAADRSLLDRYATGRECGRDHFELQDLAMRIYYTHPMPEPAAPPPDTWDGAEEWERLAFELCADEHGEESCNELIWSDFEPWGERWLKYEDEAKRMISLVRKHTAPIPAPQREWVSLTEDEIHNLWYEVYDEKHGFARAIEAALKEKNHG